MVVNQCVRLGMAIVIIALISVALYQFRAHARWAAYSVDTVVATR